MLAFLCLIFVLTLIGPLKAFYLNAKGFKNSLSNRKLDETPKMEENFNE